MNFSEQLQSMVLSTPVPKQQVEDRQERPVQKNKREEDLLNTIGLAVKRR